MPDDLKEIGITSRSHTIYIKENVCYTGTNEYFSSEIGGGVHVYSSLVEPESVQFCLDHEKFINSSFDGPLKIIPGYWWAKPKKTPGAEDKTVIVEVADNLTNCWAVGNGETFNLSEFELLEPISQYKLS